MTEQTYVHGETEVKKTGRVATKPMMGNRVLEMVEITPVNDYDGNWKKFVNPTSLLTIVDAPEAGDPPDPDNSTVCIPRST
jgi:hypothetical protein